MPKRVLFFTNIFPHYREALWEKLVSSDEFEFHFYFSNQSKFGIKVGDYKGERFEYFQNGFHILRNYYFKRLLIWQSKSIYKATFSRYHTIIFTGESQVLSTWIASIMGRLRGKKVIFWGHGLYGNEKGFKKIIRNTFNKIPSIHLVYENRAKELLVREGIDSSKIEVIYNSLDYELQKCLFEKNFNVQKSDVLDYFEEPIKPTLIYSGRLIESKQINMLIEATSKINVDQIKVNLLIVGEGNQLELLIKIASKGINEKWIYFYGPCYNEEELSKLFIASDLCVSVGNVGLLAIHSMSYGTPVCTHSSQQNQMPEVEIIEEGINGCMFEEGSLESLIQTIFTFDFSKDYTNDCRKAIDQYYNPNYQLSVFIEVI